MLALVTQPGHSHTTHIEDVPAVEARAGEVLVRTLEVGVCGTDREISEGLFGIAPEGEPLLVLGHEALAVVDRDGYGFTRSQLVTATVRRSCGHCIACAEDSPDSCLTGDYSERGITRLHGYARELVAEDPEQLVAIPKSLGRLGVLRGGVVTCRYRIAPRDKTVNVDGQVLGVDTIPENHVLFRSVNAHRRYWMAAVDDLHRARERWPEALEQFVTLHVPLDRFPE